MLQSKLSVLADPPSTYKMLCDFHADKPTEAGNATTILAVHLIAVTFGFSNQNVRKRLQMELGMIGWMMFDGQFWFSRFEKELLLSLC